MVTIHPLLLTSKIIIISNSTVTKNDLEATKQELLNKLSSKEELQKEVSKLATKEELHKELAKLATKKGLKKVDAKLEIVANQVAINTGDIKILKYDVHDIVNRLDSMENKMDKQFDIVVEILDGITARLDRNETDKAATEHTFLRHETRLEDHEKRIKNVEGELNISN